MAAAPMPWEKYSQAGEESGPWQKYGAPQEQPAAAAPPADKPSGVMDTLGREGKSLAGTIAGIPGGIYHAFADDPQNDEEKKTLADHPVLGRVGMGLGRTLVDPVKNAAQWYGEAATGKVPNAYEQALSVAPEAMGAGAASVVAPKLGEGLTKAPGAVADMAPDLGAKAMATGKVLGQEAISRIPVAGRLVRRPSMMDYVNAVRAKAPQPPPVFSKVPLGPDAPPPEVGMARGLGGYTPPEGPGALGKIPVAAPEPTPPPSNFPPPEPTSRFETPVPESPNPGRADLLEDQGVQQDMREYLDKQGRQVHAFEPAGRSKGDMAADFRETNPKPSSSSRKPAAATPVDADLTPEWQAELDRVKAAKVQLEPKTMGGAAINNELAKLDKQSSAITDKLIQAGRGNEKISETIKQSDQLSQQYKTILDRQSDLRAEAHRRYGPDWTSGRKLSGPIGAKKGGR